MKSIKEALESVKRGPTDVVGIDVQENEIRVVRIRRNDKELSLLGADTLPAIQLPQPVEESETPADIPALTIPPKLRGKHAAICMAGESSTIKLLSFPGAFTPEAEEKVVQNLGVEDPNKYRISYKLVSEGHGKSESKVLAVALPENEAAAAHKLLPTGTPAPFSLEVSSLALLTAFLRGPGSSKDEAAGSIEFGANTSTFALFSKGILSLIRRFPVGANSVVAKVQASLGVDRETAQGIMSDGAFDISQSVNEVMEPLIKQMIVSRDFVERRESCHISAIHVSGSLRSSNDLLNEIKSALSIDITPWDPFDGLTVSPDAIPENLKNRSWIFTAAVGACLGVFEET